MTCVIVLGLLLGLFFIFLPGIIGNAQIAEIAKDLPENKEEKLKIPSRILFFLSVIMIFLAAFGQYFPIFYLQLFAGLHGVSKKLTFYSIAVLNSTNALGRIFVCYIADCLEVVDVYIVIQFTLGLFENSRGVK